jgi:RNA polymerase sigma-70 factor (ECF subfamily)
MTVTRSEALPGDWPAGWAEEFSAICDSHRGRLVRWLTAIFGPRDAEDIAQEALTRLYVRPGMLDEDADAWPWLAVVARNVGRDMARHNAFSTTVEHELLDQVPDSARVHDQVVARDDAERLRLAFRSISPRDRMLIQLRDVEGVAVADIADRLGMNDNAVRQQLFRARKRLANTYLSLGGDRLGVFGTLGLRVREFLRKHGHLLEPYGATSSSFFSAVAPGIAAIVGGVLLFVTGTPGTAMADTAPYGAPAPGSGGYDAGGTRAPGTQGPGGLPGRPAPSPTSSPWVDHDYDVGPVHAGAGLWRMPYDDTGDGGTFHIHVHVDNVPVLEYVDVQAYDFPAPGGGGHHRLCHVLPCPTAPPTPVGR